jgi:uncharacterized protein with von Willebrand factor type A (vWA) domain
MNEQNCYGDGTVYRGVRSKDSEIRTVKMTKERELLRRALEAIMAADFDDDNDFDKVYTLLGEIRAYLAEPEVKREVLSDREMLHAMNHTHYFRSFEAGVRFAEKHHGIGGKDE